MGRWTDGMTGRMAYICSNFGLSPFLSLPNMDLLITTLFAGGLLAALVKVMIAFACHQTRLGNLDLATARDFNPPALCAH